MQRTRTLNRYKNSADRLFAIKANVLENTHKKSTDPHTQYQQTGSLTQNSTVSDITHKQHTNRIQNNTYTTNQVIVSDNPANIIKI